MTNADTATLQGVITDSLSGEPMPAVNVTLRTPEGEFSSLGAFTQGEGMFTITGIPPGGYWVQAMFMGYRTKYSAVFAMSAGGIYQINFQMKPSYLDPDVYWGPFVLMHLSEPRTSLALRPGDERELQPSASYLRRSSAFMLTPSKSDRLPGSRASTTEGLHLRGGRPEDALLLVDGLQSGDLSLGNPGFVPSPVGLQRMLLIPGGAPVRYGDVLSGVVDVDLREGADRYEGGLEVRTGTSSDIRRDGRTDLHSMEAYLGGPVPALKDLTFFAAGTGLLHPLKPENREDGLRTESEWDRMLTLTRRPSHWSKMVLSLQQTGQRISLDSLQFPDEEDGSEVLTNDRVGFRWMFEPRHLNCLHTLRFGYHRQVRRETDLQIPSADPGFSSNPDGLLPRSSTITRTARWDYSTGLAPFHMIEAGIQYRRVAMDLYVARSEYGNLGPLRVPLVERLGVSAEEWSLYLQNEMHVEDSVIQIGVRMDGARSIRNRLQRPTYYELEIPDPVNSYWERLPREWVSRLSVSPRLGIAVPLSIYSTLFLNIGRYTRNVPCWYRVAGFPYYSWQEPARTRAKWQERMTQFGLGAKHATGGPWEFEGEIWVKEGHNLLVSGSDRMAAFPYSVPPTGRELLDGAGLQARGLDMTALRKWHRQWYVRIAYTWSRCLLTQGGPAAPFRTNDGMQPTLAQAHPAAWDVPHRLAVTFGCDVPPGTGLHIAGLHPFGDLSAQVMVEARSGMPLPAIAATDAARAAPQRHAAVYRADLFLSRGLGLRSLDARFVVQVLNLFDNRHAITDGDTPYGISTSEDEEHELLDAADFPTRPLYYYAPPRTFQVGLRLSF